MSTAHITRCDNCGEQTESPEAQGWSKINVHPWQKINTSVPDEDAGQDSWLIRDLCPACAEKARAWLRGELAAVFRKRRNHESLPPDSEPETKA